MTSQVIERLTEPKTNGDVLDLEKLSQEPSGLPRPIKVIETSATASAEIGFSSSLQTPSTTYIQPVVQSAYEQLHIEFEKGTEPTRLPQIPRLEGLDRHDPVLTSTVRDMLPKLWAIVVSRALQTGFPIRQTVVSVFRDPEEKQARALLRLFVEANAAQAIAFWDSLERDFQDWLSGLDEHRRLSFLRTISLRVHWS